MQNEKNGANNYKNTFFCYLCIELYVRRKRVMRSNKQRHDALVVQWIEHGSPKAEI